MREDLISRFADPQKVLAQMQAVDEYHLNSKFHISVAEFCASTKLKLAHVSVAGRAFFHTSNGLPAGTLDLLKPSYKDSKRRFVYSGPFVRKEKASAFSSRNQRDSEKITGILSALKRNNEIPDDENFIHRLTPGIAYGFKSFAQGISDPEISVNNQEAQALVEFFLNNNVTYVQQHRHNLEAKYQSYLDKVAKVKDARTNLTRVTSGATIVGIIPDPIPDLNGHQTSVFYLIGEGSYNPSAQQTTFQSPLERYNSLQDTPLAADAAIIRTYAMSQSWFDSDNELGLPMVDRYFPDIDVGVGYCTHETGWWAVIPKHAA